MKKIIVLIIASILLSSGILVGAGAIENNHEIEPNQSKLEKTRFNKLFQNFLERIIEHFPVFKDIFDFSKPKYGITNACLVNLPTNPVTIHAWERPTSWSAFFKIQLSGVGSGYDVSNGEYEGWCVDYGTSIPNGVPLSVTLHSSHCPPAYLDVSGWNEINHIINNKQGDRWDIQRAIWYFINFGPWDWDKPHGESPFVTTETLNMISAATLNSGFVPVPGQVVAVICDPPNPEDRFQFTFIEVEIPDLPNGCTNTLGYWKTHSKYGPAGPRDDKWDDISPDKEDSEFFCTTISYMDIFNMSSKGGNAYLILAHQYIATELNSIANSGLPPDIQTEWLAAQPLLTQYCNDLDIPKKNPDKTKNPDRDTALNIAKILDDFNNGLYPDWPHC